MPPRPESVSDVLALVRACGVVPDERLSRFRDFLRETGLESVRAGNTTLAGLTPASILALLVEQGLLTRYQAHELAAGRTGFFIGGYRILDLLGRGGMGHVFLAAHPLLDKFVAIKVLANGDRSDDSARERFLREARAAAALDHPNIVRVFDVNIAHDPLYLVMEYVDGVSLQAAVARQGTFPAGEAAAIGIEVAMGLQGVADAGLEHRDIKPANILVDRRGGVKILDLGIARFQSDPIAKSSDAQSVVGTLDYLAPEQAIDSSKVDGRADLYSLGATLYFLLAGHPPFADDESIMKLVRKRESDPPSIVAARLDIPPGLAAVIDKLLSRSASDRYATPAEVIEALLPWAELPEVFPQRLFTVRQPNSEALGEPTSSGADPAPTPLPPTRRILLASTERPTSDGLPDAAPRPPVSPNPTERVPDFLCETDLFQTGSPTVSLTAPKPPRPSRNLGRRFWLGVGFGALAALLAAILGRAI